MSEQLPPEQQQPSLTAQPNFDSIRQVNPYGTEYWSARDLMPLLGYATWRRFEEAIKRAMSACEHSGQIVADHFVGSVKPIIGGKGAVQKVKDYNLSRLAAYLVAQNGEPSKPEIAAAQVYFAVATRQHELQEFAAEQNQRLELRERITAGNKTLDSAAQQVGVKSKSFGTFHDAGYRGLYGGLSAGQVKARKGIAPKEDLLDRAGLEELSANGLRISITERKLRSGEIVGEAAAIHTHQQVGSEIRNTIERLGGPLPEDLAPEPSVRPLLDERKRNRKKALPKPGQVSMFGDADSEDSNNN